MFPAFHNVRNYEHLPFMLPSVNISTYKSTPLFRRSTLLSRWMPPFFGAILVNHKHQAIQANCSEKRRKSIDHHHQFHASQGCVLRRCLYILSCQIISRLFSHHFSKLLLKIIFQNVLFPSLLIISFSISKTHFHFHTLSHRQQLFCN